MILSKYYNGALNEAVTYEIPIPYENESLTLKDHLFVNSNNTLRVFNNISNEIIYETNLLNGVYSSAEYVKYKKDQSKLFEMSTIQENEESLNDMPSTKSENAGYERFNDTCYLNKGIKATNYVESVCDHVNNQFYYAHKQNTANNALENVGSACSYINDLFNNSIVENPKISTNKKDSDNINFNTNNDKKCLKLDNSSNSDKKTFRNCLSRFKNRFFRKN
jgi:hypothetical protein